MIQKRFFRSTDAVELTFVLARDDVHHAAVVMDALGWTPLPMRRAPDGSGPLRAKVRVPAGPDVEFRYLVDGERWENEPDADEQRPNHIDGDNSVLRTTRPDR